ncbi:MAG: hypothetical protein Q4G04_05860 [bacterium]|nr:hypothetical protein [bacterium]
MIKLDNKGQVLVLFVCLLPIILLISILVIDITNIYGEREKLDGINKMAISYALDNLNSDNLKQEVNDLILLNDKEIGEILINIEGNTVEIYLEKYEVAYLASSINIKAFQVVSHYKGIIDNTDKKIIRRR